MIEITVAADGKIEIPADVSERLGIRPGTRLALEGEQEEGRISLRVLPAEGQLVEKEGIWVIRSRYRDSEAKEIDWVAGVRAERSASVLEDG
jgi:AbrB family looped-hinge helix DNA binding protein